MAGVKSVGRGRGWAQPQSHSDDDPLPRPGRLSNSKSEESVDPADFYNIINLINDKNLMEKVEEVLQLVDDKMKNGGFQDIVKNLYKLALKDKEFGEKLIRVCSCDNMKKTVDSQGNSFHRLLINNFQSDYERRETLRQEDPAEFHSAISIFTRYVMYKSNNLLKVFALATLTYMKMLLETHTTNDIELFTEIIVRLGKSFQTYHKEDIRKLIITCREILIKENIPDSSRLKLLYTIDLEHSGFTRLPLYLTTFYRSQLGEQYEEALQDQSMTIF